MPDRRHLRLRISAGLTLGIVGLVGVVVVTTLGLSSWRADDSETQVGAARIGDDVTVFIVDDTSTADAAPSSTLAWGLVVLGLAAVPTAAVAWVAAGSLLRRVDTAYGEVEAVEQDRQRRLQEVIHELRTPLAVMGTNLELASSGGGDDEASEFVAAARRALDRMDRTVDDLAGHGGLAIDAVDDATDLTAVAAEIAAEYVGPARARRLHVHATSTERVTSTSVEPAALRTVLGNLVGNAVELAPHGSSITVGTGAHDDWVWAAVTDEGPGIADRHHHRVFERGWRGAHARHRSIDRSGGLGLTIARQLTEAQGGRITVDSREGLGSTFTVWFPTVPDADTSAVVASDGVHPVARPWQREQAPS